MSMTTDRKKLEAIAKELVKGNGMADIVTIKRRSEIMALVGQKDTKPELFVRSYLHRKGLRYRLHIKDLPGKPDLVFPRLKQRCS